MKLPKPFVDSLSSPQRDMLMNALESARTYAQEVLNSHASSLVIPDGQYQRAVVKWASLVEVYSEMISTLTNPDQQNEAEHESFDTV